MLHTFFKAVLISTLTFYSFAATKKGKAQVVKTAAVQHVKGKKKEATVQTEQKIDLPPLQTFTEIAAPAFNARQIYAVDLKTGTVLLDRSSQQTMSPSSMTKLATILYVLQKIKEGKEKLSTEVPISRKAWKTMGSKMFVAVNQTVPMEELIKGMIIVSGNDACVAVGEHFGGEEAVFVDLLNKWLQELGLTNTVFKNSHGLPAEGHVSTAQDIAKISEYLVRQFPEYMPLFAETEYTHNGITQPNRLPLLTKNVGCKGLKTGFTEDGGYGLAAYIEQGHMSFIFVINGLPSARARAKESLAIAQWIAKIYATLRFAKKDQVMGYADVWHGEEETVPLVVNKDVFLTIPKTLQDQIKASIQFKTPLQAPIEKGSEIGTLTINVKGIEKPFVYPIFAGKHIGQGGVFKRLSENFKQLVVG